MSHQCPAPNCVSKVPDDQLACPGHWFRLTTDVRRRILRAWWRERDDHIDAVKAALEEMKAWETEDER